ncbi:MAG: hypothetical protein RBT70_01470 [Alphaproteobacteria bacterium]|jgi:hypothetical protein|nr:hypothetical protein [Alphaproteobacteria bacterium]
MEQLSIPTKYFFFSQKRLEERERPESIARYSTCLAFLIDQGKLVEYTHTRLMAAPQDDEEARGSSAHVAYIRFERGYDAPSNWLKKIGEENREALEKKLEEIGLTLEIIQKAYAKERTQSYWHRDYKAIKSRDKKNKAAQPHRLFEKATTLPRIPTIKYDW